MISNYTRELYKPVFQYRATQANPYTPKVDSSELYTTDKGRPIVRCAYMKPMVGSSGGRHLTGVDPAKPFINKSCPVLSGTRASAFNYGGNYSGSCVLNSRDKVEQDILYGGMQVSFQYRFDYQSRPSVNGLTFQVASHRPYYENDGGNRGGNIAMVLNFATTGVQPVRRIGMVVRLYALNESQGFNERIVGFDPNSGKLHVEEALFCENKWLTTSPESDGSKHSRGDRLFGSNPKVFNNFFSFGLDEKFDDLLIEAAKPAYFGKHIPLEKWELYAASIQFELNESGSAIMGGAFSGFRIGGKGE